MSKQRTTGSFFATFMKQFSDTMYHALVSRKAFPLSHGLSIRESASCDTRVSLAAPDHATFTCSTSLEYDGLLAKLRAEAVEVRELTVDGGRVTLLRFRFGAPTALGNVSTLELVDQRRDKSLTSGFTRIVYVPATTYAGGVRGLVETVKSRGLTFTAKNGGTLTATTYELALTSDFAVQFADESIWQRLGAGSANGSHKRTG